LLGVRRLRRRRKEEEEEGVFVFADSSVSFQVIFRDSYTPI
jgi:hypothetical protein